GGVVRLICEPRAFFPVDALELVEAIVERAGEVRRRLAGFAAADGAVVEHDHALAFLGEQVRAGETGDARADDAHVGFELGRERRPLLERARGLPKGSRSLR